MIWLPRRRSGDGHKIRNPKSKLGAHMSTKTVLILHGWGGNKAEHWQEWLYKELQAADGCDVPSPKFPNPQAPHLASWLIALDGVVKELPEPNQVTVLCHSLGAITWMHYSTAIDH